MTDDRDFDRWLAREFARHRQPIADDGFSQRVSARLVTEAGHSRRRAALAVVLCALLAGTLAYALVPWVMWVHALVALFAGIPPLTLLQLGLGMTLGLIATTWAAIRFERVLA